MGVVSAGSRLAAPPHHGPYAATKGGMNQMFRVMAREWARYGVTVNAVAPGYIETDLTKDYLDKDNHRESLESLVPAERLGRPEEVADAVTFLASDRSRFITGQILYVDGGRVVVWHCSPSFPGERTNLVPAAPVPVPRRLQGRSVVVTGAGTGFG